MQNQFYRVSILSVLFLIIFSSCTLPTSQESSVQNPPTNTQPEEPTIQEEEPSAPESASEPSAPVEEEAPSGGGSESTDVSVSQNPLPSAVNLEESSIDLERLGKENIGGGGGPGCNNFAGQTEQEISLTYPSGILNFHNIWQMCFIGYPQAVAEMRLSTSSGIFDTSLSLEPQLGAHGINLNLPASILRDGPLHVDFTIEGVNYSKSFDIQTFDQVSIHQDRANMLDLGEKTIPEFNLGEQFELLGVNLLPNTSVFVGIYGFSVIQGISSYFYLVDQFEVKTNESGEFLGTVRITEKYRQSRNPEKPTYIIYYGYDPDLLTNKREDEKYDKFRVGSTSTTWQPCLADYASRLRAFDIGIVSDNPPLPNNVRNNPSLSGEMIGQLQTGEQFIILDGPVCEGGWVWWYVQSANNIGIDQALKGWTSEGDSNNYWLIPNDLEEPKG